VVTEPLVIGDTTVAADTIASFAADADTDEASARQRITDMITMYPPTDIEAAKNVTPAGPDKSQERKLAIIDAMEGTGIYSAEWIAAAREAGKKPKVVVPVETNIDKAAKAIQILNPNFATGDNAYLDAISTQLNISRDEARKLLPEAKKAYAELKRKAVPQKDKRPDQLLADIRNAKTEEAHEAAVAAYSEKTGIDVEDVKSRNPFKPTAKAKGGLMARGA
jgi:hypothetical protein